MSGIQRNNFVRADEHVTKENEVFGNVVGTSNFKIQSKELKSRSLLESNIKIRSKRKWSRNQKFISLCGMSLRSRT